MGRLLDRHRVHVLALALALALTGATPPGHGTTPPEGDPAGPPASVAEPDCQWWKYGRELGLSFAQPDHCVDLSPTNATTLLPKWVMPAPDSVTASPSVVDGVVYVGDWQGTFYALPTDPEGTSPLNEPLWTFEVTDENNVSFGTIVSSAAVADVGDQRVVAFGGGSTLYVLDAESGDKLARSCLDPRAEPDPPADPIRCRGSEDDIETESSPAIVEVDGETLILIGNSVHNDAGIGRTGMIAHRLVEDGGAWDLEPLWKFDPETKQTYTTDASRDGDEGFVHTDQPLTYDAGNGHGCGGVWSSPAIDVEAGLVFFGTADCHFLELPEGEIGGEGVWAVDLESGAYAWHFQPRGLNLRDDDFGASPNLLPVEHPELGPLVGAGGKDGRYYAFPRQPAPGPDGQQEPAWISHPGQPGHLQDRFALGGILGTPAVGEVAGEPAVFATTAVSTPIDNDSGDPTLDASLLEDPGRMLSLHAISADDGRLLWRSALARESYGAPTYANGVLLVPSTFGFSLKAFHADTGLPLGALPLNGPPSSAPAVVGDSVYIGAGTRDTDAEYKAFGGDPVEELTDSPSPLSPLSGVFAFQLAEGLLSGDDAEDGRPDGPPDCAGPPDGEDRPGCGPRD